LRTFERLLVVAVSIVLAVYVASYAYLDHPTSRSTLDISALLPPRIGVQVYTGDPLNVTESLIIIRVVAGSIHTVNLRIQSVIALGTGSTTDLGTCLYVQHQGQLVIGPCYSQSLVETVNSQTVIFTFYDPVFNVTRILDGYYNEVYSPPYILGYYCAQQPSLYVNSTLFFHAASNACILVRLIQAKYSYSSKV